MAPPQSQAAPVGDAANITVQVCYAPPPPAAPVMLQLKVAPGTTLAAAVALSAPALPVPATILAACRTGIWGKLRPAETVLREADRIELYRPLSAEPKEARRRRAKEKAAPAG
jgi:putative ubiquitin-RnfH superfamily antitoxin RatB of RatAB toxin-antitoxin module